MLQENCQRVIIVWDLHPPWHLENPKAEKPCRREEREAIFRSLEDAGVISPNVHLICICEELEAWLIADNRAIAKAISRFTGRKKPKIKEEKKPESVKRPKMILMKIFRQHTHEYRDHYDALRIVKELPDFNKIKRSQSFARFALKATDTEL